MSMDQGALKKFRMNPMSPQTKKSVRNTERLLDGPLLVFDLPSLMEKLKLDDVGEKSNRNAITLLKSDNMRLVLIALRAGAEIDFRQSDNLISLQLLKGKLEFIAENYKVVLEQGQLLTLHENIPHSLTAVNETIFLLTIGNTSVPAL